MQRTARATIKLSIDGSSVRTRQIDSGATTDVFGSADTAWMSHVQRRSLIRMAGRKDVPGNRPLPIARADRWIQLKIAPHSSLAVFAEWRLPSGDLKSVPAGRCASSALTKLGVRDEVPPEQRVATASASRFRTPFRLRLHSTPLIQTMRKVLRACKCGHPPRGADEPIVYAIALKQSAEHQAVVSSACLTGPEPHDIFVNDGFTIGVPCDR